MNVMFATEGVVPLDPRAFELLDIAARRLDLLRRIRIARIKQEHGMLTEEEQDALIDEGAELKADAAIWRKCR